MANKFSYKDYYEATVALEEVFRTEETPRWYQTMPSDVRRITYLVYLGCNILKTTHLVETLCRVLDALGADYAAVGGPVFCCGAVPRGKGDINVGDGMFSRTLKLFGRFAPETLVHWCPSCETEFDLKSDSGPFDFSQIHFTGFLRSLLKGQIYPNSVRRRVALHYHAGADRPTHESEDALAILKSIPGLEVVPLICPAAFGTHCSSQGAVRQLGVDRYQDMVREEFQRAASLGCDGLVSIYHSCHREFCKARRQTDIEVVNYVTLVAQALNLEVPEDTFQRLAAQGNLQQALEELSPVIESRNLNRDALKNILKSQLGLS